MNKKHIKLGAYSTVLCIVAVAIAIIVNMIIGKVPTKFTKFDTTGFGLYDLSKDTEEIIKSVKDDITLTLVAQSGSENETVLEFLNRYASLNKKIEVKVVDPVVTPTIASANGTTHDLSQMVENSVVVSSDKRDFEVSYDTIFYTQYTQQEIQQYYMYYGQAPENPTYFGGEQAITGAIDNVTTDDLPNIYTLTGHNETELGSNLQKYIATDNYNLNTFTLKTGDGSVPADADIVIINIPTADISEDELNTLKSYVDNGGKIVLVTSFNTKQSEFKNLNSLEAYFGMNILDGIVLESDSNRYYQVPYMLVPVVSAESEITAGFNALTLMPRAEGFTVSGDAENGLSVSKIITTSSGGFTAGISGENIDAKNHLYDGEIVIGAEATKTVGENEGKFVWYSSMGITDDDSDQVSSGNNSALLLSTFAKISGKTTSVSIASKIMKNEALVVSSGAANIWSTIITIIIPIAIIGTGFAVWASRRKK